MSTLWPALPDPQPARPQEVPRPAADVAFGVVTLLAGLVCGVVAGWLGRRHGPAVVLGLLVGGPLGARASFALLLALLTRPRG